MTKVSPVPGPAFGPTFGPAESAGASAGTGSGVRAGFRFRRYSVSPPRPASRSRATMRPRYVAEVEDDQTIRSPITVERPPGSGRPRAPPAQVGDGAAGQPS